MELNEMKNILNKYNLHFIYIYDNFCISINIIYRYTYI